MKKKTAHHIPLPVLIVVTVILFLALYGLKMVVWPSSTFDSHSTYKQVKYKDLTIADFVGSYTAVLPSADSPGQRLTLLLINDGLATLTSDLQNGQPTVFQTGNWTISAPNYVILTLNQQGEEVLTPPILIRLEKSKSRLTAVEYDHKLYGEEGLKFVETNSLYQTPPQY